MRSTLYDDVALSVLSFPEGADDRVVLRVTVQPLVAWLWIGGLVVAAGTALGPGADPAPPEEQTRTRARAAPGRHDRRPGPVTPTPPPDPDATGPPSPSPGLARPDGGLDSDRRGEARPSPRRVAAWVALPGGGSPRCC